MAQPNRVYNVTRISGDTTRHTISFYENATLVGYYSDLARMPERSLDNQNIILTGLDDRQFWFNAWSLTRLASNVYTVVSPIAQDANELYQDRLNEVYIDLCELYHQCCCGGDAAAASCDSEYVYIDTTVSDVVSDGLFSYIGDVSGGIIELSNLSSLGQDYTTIFASLPNLSWLKFYNKDDLSLLFTVEISNYVIDVSSNTVSWDAEIVGGDIPTDAVTYCFSYDIAGSGGPSSPQDWQNTLIEGPNLTQDNTSNAGNFDFTWTNFKTWLLQATSFLNDVVSAIRLRTTGASSTFLIQHDATTNPLQVDVNSSGGTTWNTLGPTRFIGDASNVVNLETTGFGSRRNDLNMKATDNSGTDTPDDRNVINFYNDKNDGNGMRKWFAMRQTDLSTIEVFGIFAYDPAGSAALDRWAFCVTAGAFSNPYSNNTFIGQLSNAGTTAYPFAEKIKDLIANGSLVLMHQNVDFFNTTLLTVANTYANSPIVRFVPRVWVTGDPTELFGAVKHAYQLQQQFSAVNGDSAWQVGFKDAETDLLPALLRSFLVYYDGTVQLGAYPDTRDDGPTTKALYVDVDGKVKHGDISGGHTKVTVVGSQASTTSVLADVTGLLVPLLSGTTYHFRVFCTFDSSSTAVGSLWSINGPAASYLAYSSTWSLVATGNPTNNNGMSAYQLPAAPSGTSAATSGNTAMIEGVVTPSANGNLQVQFAREGAAGTTTFRTGIILLETM